jgi:hypothetical protein
MFALIQAYAFVPVLESPVDDYLARKGKLASITTTKAWSEKNSQYDEIELVSSSGLRVLMTIRRPLAQQHALPVVLLLGGLGTGRDACRVIPTIRHAVCVSLSYPYYGADDIEGIGVLTNLREVQQAVIDTPPAMLLALDYVLTQDYTDAQQVELLGVSFGAYFISIPAVLDQRVTRTWIVHGGAEPIKVMSHNYIKNSENVFLKKLFVKWIGYAIGSQYVDPEKWVGKISPRPVILINAENDKTFPESSVKALHNTTRQPKEIIWTKGVHIAPSRTDIVEQLSNIVLNRIEGDYLKRRSNHR